MAVSEFVWLAHHFNELHTMFLLLNKKGFVYKAHIIIYSLYIYTPAKSRVS